MNESSITEITEMLFYDAGEKIKKMATILFWVEAVACVILAFGLGWEKTSYWGDKEFRPVIFFGFLIGGPLASYCSALMLYGFGELVDKIGGLHMTDSSTSENVSSNVATCYASPVPVKTVDRVSDLISNPNQKTGGNTWLCSCGRCNPKYVSSCVCGKNKHDQ